MPSEVPNSGDSTADRNKPSPASQELTAKYRALDPKRADREFSGDDTATPGEKPASPDASAGPPTIPHYDIVGELGRGGMGVVYKAWHVPSKRFVALKMVVPGAESSEAILRRFKAEGEAVAKLSHPNIVQVHEIGEFHGWPYFALELCGGSLAKKLAGNPMQPSAAAALVEKLARAIAAAHKQQIVHRDLKPGNVLLMPDGEPKITDFGLAKKLDADASRHPQSQHNRANAVLGTPSYMPPEQADGTVATTGPAVDIYALGAILYECLTGRPPFRGASLLDTLEQIRHQEPIAPTLYERKTPADLETICLKCLRKKPGQRYASAEDLADDLKRFLKGIPIKARPTGWLTRLLTWRKQRPRTATTILVLVVLVIMSLAGAIWRINDLDQKRRAAEDIGKSGTK